MESKKPILIGIIVVCLAAAIGLTVMRNTGGTKQDFSEDKQFWLKCSNPDCGVEFQMGTAKYFQEMEKSEGILACKDCGEPSIYRAEKCPKCGVVFFRGAVKGSFKDKCPECSFSQMEEDRK